MPATVILPAVDLGPFDFEENLGSPKEGFTDEGFKATRELICPWPTRTALAIALRGNVGVSGGQTVIVRPQPYPDYPKAMVVAVDCSPFSERVLPHDGNEQRASYTHALLTAQYATPKFDIESGEGETYVSESLEPAAEFVTLSGHKLWWNSGKTIPASDTEAPQKLLRMLEWVYTIHKIAAVPAATFTLLGCVNDGSVTSRTLGMTFATETLLYNPPQLSREWTAGGVPTWTLQYRLTYKPAGWNKFFKAGSATPATLYDDTGAAFLPYTPANFGALVG